MCQWVPEQLNLFDDSEIKLETTQETTQEVSIELTKEESMNIKINIEIPNPNIGDKAKIILPSDTESEITLLNDSRKHVRK